MSALGSLRYVYQDERVSRETSILDKISNTLARANSATEIMSGPGVGFEYPSVPVSWYKRDVLLFANAIGCDAKDELHFLYVCVIRVP